MANFVAEIDVALAEKMKNDLLSQGFELSQPQYTLFSAKKKGVSCTLYKSGKLMVQGKDQQEFIEFYLEPQILGTFSYTHQEAFLNTSERIGGDEAGKGDFFGPLCTAALYSNEEGVLRLKEIGVKDSKSMNDAAILKIGRKIEREFKHHLLILRPEKYNELYPKFGSNLNTLLAWSHAVCIENLTKETGCRKVIVDQFASKSVLERAVAGRKIEVDLIQRTKGEQDIVVAGASILARKGFVETLEKMEREYGLSLPKGGSSPKLIAAGKHFIVKYGKECLNKVAKTHFKTIESL